MGEERERAREREREINEKNIHRHSGCMFHCKGEKVEEKHTCLRRGEIQIEVHIARFIFARGRDSPALLFHWKMPVKSQEF